MFFFTWASLAAAVSAHVLVVRMVRIDGTIAGHPRAGVGSGRRRRMAVVRLRMAVVRLLHVVVAHRSCRAETGSQ